MGQNDVLIWLKERYKENPDKWFTVNQIKLGLKKKGASKPCLNRITQHLFKLNLYGFIEFKGKGFWDHYRLFRYKED